MIKEHAHHRACPILPRLLSVTVIRRCVDEVGHCDEDGEARVKVTGRRIAIEVEHEAEASHVPREAPHGDEVGGQPGGQFAHDVVAKRALDVLVIWAVARAFRSMVYYAFVVLLLDVGSVRLKGVY